MDMEINMEWKKNNGKIFGGHQSFCRNMKQAIGLSLLKLSQESFNRFCNWFFLLYQKLYAK